MKAKGLTRETILELGTAKRPFPAISIGDTVSVSLRIQEGDKERLQAFEGDVLAIHHNGIGTTFTVRKISANNVAVERIFPYYSPLIESVTFVRKGKARRAKLYYIRERLGKAARIEEEVITRQEREQREAVSE